MSSALDRSSRWWMRPAGAVGVLLAIVLVAGGTGVAIGRATAKPSSTNARGANSALPYVSTGSLSAPHGPTRMQGDLPVGFTDDKGGALSCAAVVGETLIDYVQIRRTMPAQTWISTYVTGQLSNESMQRIYDWNPLQFQMDPSDRPTELAPRLHALSVSQLVPAGYKILAFSTSAAHVQVWFNGVGWSQGSGVPNTVVNRSADIELLWKSGDWKITNYTNPHGQSWDGPGLDDPNAAGFAPWPGGQFTFVTG
jgi:hypothetical protein